MCDLQLGLTAPRCRRLTWQPGLFQGDHESELSLAEFSACAPKPDSSDHQHCWGALEGASLDLTRKRRGDEAGLRPALPCPLGGLRTTRPLCLWLPGSGQASPFSTLTPSALSFLSRCTCSFQRHPLLCPVSCLPPEQDVAGLRPHHPHTLGLVLLVMAGPLPVGSCTLHLPLGPSAPVSIPLHLDLFLG